MEEQLVQAVQIASNPTAVQDPSLPAQALNFLEHLKTITHESWSAGWAVFSARSDAGDQPRYDQQARMFGLNLVAEYLENHVGQSSDPAASIAFLQESTLSYVQAEFVVGTGERGASYIKNKLAQVVTMLLLQTYGLPQPPTLLPSLLALFRTHAPSSQYSQTSTEAPLNPSTTDLVLRILHDLSVTLGSDVTLRAVRSKERLHRDSVIRDEIRTNHAAAIASAVWTVVEEGLQRLNSGNDAGAAAGWNPAKSVESIEMAMAVIGDYASWIDISLMVSQRTIAVFFELLRHSILGLRGASAAALLELVSKGMKAASKLELLQVLDLTNTVGSLEAETRQQGSQGDELVELREKFARLANGVTLELVKILEDSTAEEATRSAADAMLLQHLSLVLAFLADEYDDPTECVISGVNATLGYYKKLKKKPTPGGSLQQTHLEALTRLTEVALQKMKYDDEAEWTGAGTRVDRDGDGGISDDDEAVFVELRKQLQQILAAVASIDESIFTTRVQNLIMETLNAAEQSLQGNGPTLTWQQAEVAVFAAYFFVEVLINAPGQTKSGVSVNTFVELPPEHQRTSTAVATKSSKLSFSVYPTLPLNALGRTIQAVAQSSISQFPHPAVQLQYFECLNRYSAFFVTRPDNLSTALFAFLDQRGIYNSHQGVRHRVWYLFSRFVKEVAVVVPGDYVAKVSQSLRDVLVVNADLPQASADEDPLRKATETAGLFDSQLYLFESVGCLISTLRSNPQQVVELLRAASEPLVVQLDNAVQAFSNKGGDLREVLQAHHLILALSTLSQGFPDLGNGTLTATDEGWVEVFKSMTERVLLALNALNRFSIIREASRGAFSRIIATTGRAVLPLIPNLIQGLLGEITAPELVDFLSFLGLLVSKFKNEIRPMLDELLLVLLDRIFHFLNQEVTGTDDAVQKTDLQRAYVAFLAILLNAGLDSIFLSDRNKDQLQTILQSVVYYASNGDPLCQKACFNILNRLVTLWGSPAAVSANGNGTNGVTSANVPGFEGFIYETLVPLTFEVPAKASFDFGDAQAQQVLTEIANLLKVINQKRGAELSSYLTEVYFPGIQCPPEISRGFVENLQTLEGKKFKSYLQGFIASSRS